MTNTTLTALFPNGTQLYTYRLTKEQASSISAGDHVLVPVKNLSPSNMKVVQVHEVHDEERFFPAHLPSEKFKWIVQKVELDDFLRRSQDAEEVALRDEATNIAEALAGEFATATELAEEVAQEMNQLGWLNDPEHWIWEVAAEAFLDD